MSRTALLAAFTVCWLVAGPAAAVDTIKLEKENARGEVTSVSPTEVKLKPTTGDEERVIPVNEIEFINFEAQPSQINQIRTHIKAGRFQEAHRAAERLDPAKTERALIKVEIAFQKALTSALLAKAGSGSVSDAGNAMAGFIKNHPESYHILEANELVGDLFAAVRKFDLAEASYKTIGDTAPWPDYRMKAEALRGRVLLRQDKIPEALSAFDAALALGASAEGPLVVRQRARATIGQATCQGLTGKADEAVKTLEELVEKAEAEDAETNALAYNALGTIHRKASRPKEACIAFLFVDVVYPRGGTEAHAEALANLAELWSEMGQGERALEYRNQLQASYPNSEWARK